MRHEILTPAWWAAAAMRALKTVAQTAVATIGTSAFISAVDWRMVLSASVLAGILSLLTSLAGLPEVEPKEIEYKGNRSITEEDRENE